MDSCALYISTPLEDEMASGNDAVEDGIELELENQSAGNGIRR